MAKRPPSAPALQRRSAGRRGLVIALASSAVAASLFLALLLPVGRDAPPAAGPAVAVNAAAARDVSIEYVQNLNRIQETRPCDILPPLPSSL